MMILNAILRSFVLLAFALIASTAVASELSDSMQLFFDGEYKIAQQRLTAMINQGHADARLYFFRGLASNRLGDARSASMDFEKGASLELLGANHGIGRSLQRVQGTDRLMLEKYRTMARLSARRRVQPVAPKPAVPTTEENDIQLTVAEVPANAPLFRLASEIPLRNRGAADPFRDDLNTTSNLASEPMPTGPLIAPTANEQEDIPVGTGVAQSGEANTDFDPFSVPSATPVDVPSSNVQSSGIVGSVFRALTRAAVPKVPESLIPSGFFPNSGADEESVPTFDANDDPFGDSSSSDGDDGSDPFDDF